MPTISRTSISHRLTNISSYVRKHKLISSIVLIVILGAGYQWYRSTHGASTVAQYTLGTVSTGTVISTVSASGQIAASDKADIRARISGTIVSVSAKTGQSVQQGQGIAHIDSVDAQQAVTDAELAVEQARLNLEHDTLQSPVDYKTLQDTLAQATKDLNGSYQDAYAALADAHIKFPDMLTGTEDMLNNSNINPNSKNLFVSTPSDQQVVQSLLAKANADYQTARNAYSQSVITFRTLTVASPPEQITQSLGETRATGASVFQAVTSESNFIDALIAALQQHNLAISSDITSAQTTIRTYVTNSTTIVTNLTSAQKKIDDAKKAVSDAQHALDLAGVDNPNGNSSFALKLTENTLKQKEAALNTAQQALADHEIHAPFSGVVASLTIRQGDNVASGGSIGTIITDQQIAQLSLNEIDAAKINIGDKATLSFDAIQDLTLTGEVAEIDPVGTVAQGVVSYGIQIATDMQDPRVKSGMTVNANIQMAVHQNVLVVPSSAVKTSNGASYVQVFNTAIANPSGNTITPTQTPQNVPVTIGISDDTNTEIISGLTAGEQIITKTSASSATKTAAATATSRGGFGGGGGGGGNVLRGL